MAFQCRNSCCVLSGNPWRFIDLRLKKCYNFKVVFSIILISLQEKGNSLARQLFSKSFFDKHL